MIISNQFAFPMLTRDNDVENRSNGATRETIRRSPEITHGYLLDIICFEYF